MSNIDRLTNATVNLIVKKRKIDNKIMVYFEDTYESDGYALIGSYGTGESVEEAATDYYKKIKGKKIIVNPSSKTRKEIIFL